jgi:hypothetical protein
MPSKIGGVVQCVGRWADFDFSDALEDLARANTLVSWFLRVRSLFEEVEPRYEDRALLRYVAHSHDCARPRPNIGKATDRRG